MATEGLEFDGLIVGSTSEGTTNLLKPKIREEEKRREFTTTNSSYANHEH